MQSTGDVVLARDITVILGAHNIRRKIEPGRSFAAVKSIKIHDRWNPSSDEFEGDVALLKLTEPITVTKFIKPVCIANSQTLPMSYGNVVGWGVEDDTDEPSDIPKKIQILVLSELDCLKKQPGLTKIFSHDLFCAGKDGAGVCKGDSGSGFYVQENERFYLKGIVSSSSGKLCSNANLALYSDIFKNLDFIQRVCYKNVCECCLHHL